MKSVGRVQTAYDTQTTSILVLQALFPADQVKLKMGAKDHQGSTDQ